MMKSFGAVAAVIAIAALTVPAGATTVDLTDGHGAKYQAQLTQSVLQAKTSTTPEIVQPTLTIYKITSTGRSKVWTAPASVVPKVQRVSKDAMGWQPLVLTVTDMHATPVVPGRGTGLAFVVHQSSADCGAASVDIVGLNNGAPREVVSVTNYCGLSYIITGRTLVLTGPMYKSSDPLCCPSKAKAHATLSFSGSWKLSPPIYKLVVPPMD